jgi:hypothetical protein
MGSEEGSVTPLFANGPPPVWRERLVARIEQAVGDVIGPPALASAATGQGRRAVCHAR